MLRAATDNGRSSESIDGEDRTEFRSPGENITGGIVGWGRRWVVSEGENVHRG